MPDELWRLIYIQALTVEEFVNQRSWNYFQSLNLVKANRKSRVPKLRFYFFDFFLPLLYRFLVYFLQILMKTYLLLHPVALIFIVVPKDYFDWILEHLLNFHLSLLVFLQCSHIKKFKSVLYSYAISICLAVHQKLGQMEKFLRFSSSFVHHAFFVHFFKLLQRNLLVQIFIEFPDHSLYFLADQVHFHFS